LHGALGIVYKAIQLDSGTRQRTGREYALAAETRQAAIDELLGLLEVKAGEARVDPTRTLVQLRTELWTIVGVSPSAPPADEPAGSLRRAGAKHRRVR
jgi:hypothetical protein